jgi:hypothetical protein
MSSVFGASVSCLTLAILLTSSNARAQPRWDGLDALLRTARSSGTELTAAATLDLGRLEPRDALLISGPGDALPVGALTTFLREGGRVALLDDFGGGERLLAAYQVNRLPPPEADVPSLRGSRALLIAYPASEHPLVEGVDLLLTNGATALAHHDLNPVFTFGHSERALVLAGAVGAGRLVAIGDASLLINQLMILPSHQRFATNLISYLKRPSGRVFLVDGHTRFQGNYGANTARVLAHVDGFLKRMARPNLPPGVLSLVSLGLCAIAAVIAIGSLPRRSPYARSELIPRASVYAGFAARVSLSERDPPNLIWTLLDYRRELTAELFRRLDLQEPSGVDAIAARALQRGLPPQQGAELKALLGRLEQLALIVDTQATPPRIRVNELRNVVRQGEELLTRLGNG